MGRLIPPIAQQIRIIQEAYKPFRRTLRAADQRHFDRLFAAANYHRAPISQASRALPMEAMLFSMALEQDKRIEQLEIEQAENKRELEEIKKLLQTLTAGELVD